MKLFLYSAIVLSLSLNMPNCGCLISENSSPQYEQSFKKSEKGTKDDLVLAVNAVNNILTYMSLAVAILTFATILFGYLGYKDLKRKIEDKVKEVNAKMKDIEAFKDQVKESKKMLDLQEEYVSISNGYLYQTTEQLVNQIDDSKIAMVIYKTLAHNYHVANLYSSNNETRFAALAYLRENGEPSDITHIQAMASSDVDQQYQQLASEIIGVIKYKTENEKNSHN